MASQSNCFNHAKVKFCSFRQLGNRQIMSITALSQNDSIAVLLLSTKVDQDQQFGTEPAPPRSVNPLHFHYQELNMVLEIRKPLKIIILSEFNVEHINS